MDTASHYHTTRSAGTLGINSSLNRLPPVDGLKNSAGIEIRRASRGLTGSELHTVCDVLRFSRRRGRRSTIASAEYAVGSERVEALSVS